MTGYTASKSRRRMMTLQSDAEPWLTDILLEDVPITDFAHCFLSVQMFDALMVEYVPTGSESHRLMVEVKVAGSQHYEKPPLYTIIPSEPTTICWAGNTVAIRVSETIGGAGDAPAFYKVVVTANRT